MVKDESKNIETTLNTIPYYIKILIVLDTGSTDNTIEIIKEYCDVHFKTLHLRETTFTTFDRSRNELLDFINEVFEGYTIILDAKDELRITNKTTLKTLKRGKDEVYAVARQFDYLDTIEEFSNLLCIRIPTKWRYRGTVHNYLIHPERVKNKVNILKGIKVYQKREYSDITKRHESIVQLLLEQAKSNDIHEKLRAIYLLGCTYQGVKKDKESFHYFRKYTEMASKNVGTLTHIEQLQLFRAVVECCKTCFRLQSKFRPDTLSWLQYALELQPKRAEPYVLFASWYTDQKNYNLAKIYNDFACSLPEPGLQSICHDKRLYTFRWELAEKIKKYI